MSPINHGVVILPFTSPRPDWPERTEFWMMRYRSGPAEVVDKWAFPGGGVEPGERVLNAAIREFVEETGLQPMSHRLISLGERTVHERPENSVRRATHGQFYYMNYFAIRIGSREYPPVELLRNMEPKKHSAWRPFPIFDLPHPVTEATEIAIGRFMTAGGLAGLCR